MYFRKAWSSLTAGGSTTVPTTTPSSSERHAQSSVSGWKGLEQWRKLPIEERRVWGKNTPVLEKEPVLGGGLEVLRQNENPDIDMSELAKWGELVLATADPLEKAFLTHQAYRSWRKGGMRIGTGAAPDKPGRPSKPQLVRHATRTTYPYRSLSDCCFVLLVSSLSDH